MVVVLLIVLLLMLLASFLANDAAASFDERRSPPAAKRGQVGAGPSPWAEQEVLAGSPAGRTSTIAKPPEVVASRAGDLTPWSAGGPGPVRTTRATVS